MKKDYDTDFQLLPIPEVQPQQEEKIESKLQHRPSRMNFSFELIEKIKDYAYWQGFTQQQVVTEAIEHFFKDREVKSRPEAAKNRPRPGRKPKL